ncbi:MAG: hypothetical protein KIS87_02805 [Phycisphaeraceae bacterium]|nr:hypothetical protein [Phycisphaeraceae bacterium]
MPKKKVYIAFDYDDLGVKQNLIAESQRPDCPWEFVDNSLSRAIPDRWTAEAERLIRISDFVIVICGTQTHQANGVAVEVQLAQKLGKPYFLLSGTRKGTPCKPKHARAEDMIWTYRWPTLRTLLCGGVPPQDAALR